MSVYGQNARAEVKGNLNDYASSVCLIDGGIRINRKAIRGCIILFVSIIHIDRADIMGRSTPLAHLLRVMHR